MYDYMSVNWVTIVGSGNDLLSVWHQAIIWTVADFLVFRNKLQWNLIPNKRNAFKCCLQNVSHFRHHVLFIVLFSYCSVAGMNGAQLSITDGNSVTDWYDHVPLGLFCVTSVCYATCVDNYVQDSLPRLMSMEGYFNPSASHQTVPGHQQVECFNIKQCKITFGMCNTPWPT